LVARTTPLAMPRRSETTERVRLLRFTLYSPETGFSSPVTPFAALLPYPHSRRFFCQARPPGPPGPSMTVVGALPGLFIEIRRLVVAPVGVIET
jgi:hypothetical protein